MRFIGTGEICPLPAFVRKPAGGRLCKHGGCVPVVSRRQAEQ